VVPPRSAAPACSRSAAGRSSFARSRAPEQKDAGIESEQPRRDPVDTEVVGGVYGRQPRMRLLEVQRQRAVGGLVAGIQSRSRVTMTATTSVAKIVNPLIAVVIRRGRPGARSPPGGDDDQEGEPGDVIHRAMNTHTTTNTTANTVKIDA